jgi:tetratricopeptide (TPR) repeat protein
MNADLEPIPSPDTAAWTSPGWHLGIAEQGKLYALEGKHELALAYYRESIRLTVQAGEAEIVFRHYLECVLESLELMGSYREVLDYCDKAIDLLTSQEAEAQTGADLAHVYQRRGIVQLKSGHREAAIESLRKSLELGTAHRYALPLAKTLLGWLERGLQVDARRVLAEQQRTHYFNVRPDTVDKERAVRLPNEQLILGMASAQMKKEEPWHAT